MCQHCLSILFLLAHLIFTASYEFNIIIYLDLEWKLEGGAGKCKEGREDDRKERRWEEEKKRRKEGKNF